MRPMMVVSHCRHVTRTNSASTVSIPLMAAYREAHARRGTIKPQGGAWGNDAIQSALALRSNLPGRSRREVSSSHEIMWSGSAAGRMREKRPGALLAHRTEEGIEPDDLLCSHNARPQNGMAKQLVGGLCSQSPHDEAVVARCAQWRPSQPPRKMRVQMKS